MEKKKETIKKLDAVATEAKKETLKKAPATAKKEPKASTKSQVIEEVKEQQKVSILEKVISTREVKYIYPENITNTLDRKRWRQHVRNELHKLEREAFRIKDQNSKEFKDAQKAYQDFCKKILKPEQVA